MAIYMSTSTLKKLKDDRKEYFETSSWSAKYFVVGIFWTGIFFRLEVHDISRQIHEVSGIFIEALKHSFCYN